MYIGSLIPVYSEFGLSSVAPASNPDPRPERNLWLIGSNFFWYPVAAMAVVALAPYLNFSGNAAQALELYQQALGAVVNQKMLWGDHPDGVPEEMRGNIMHADLQINKQTLLLADGAKPDESQANHVGVCLECDDLASMKLSFAQLESGGRVIMPLSDTFWGAVFGIVEDRFGVRWLFNYTKTS
jgi:PhnB protein